MPWNVRVAHLYQAHFQIGENRWNMSGSLWLTVLTAAAAIGEEQGEVEELQLWSCRGCPLITWLVGLSPATVVMCPWTQQIESKEKSVQSTKHRHVKYTLRNWCIRLEASVIEGLIKPPTTHAYNEIKLALNTFPQRMLSDQETRTFSFS